MSASKVDDIRGVRTELVFWPPHAWAHVHALRKKNAHRKAIQRRWAGVNWKEAVSYL